MEIPMEQFSENTAARYVILVTSPILIISGTAGNILSFCVFYPKAARSKNRSSYSFLAILAVFDTLSLILSTLRGFLREAFGLDIVLKCRCGWYLFLNYLFTDMAVYVVICMTLDRAISVFFPFKAKVYCTRNRAIFSTFVFFVFLVGINCGIIFAVVPRSVNLSENVTDDSISCSAPDEYQYFLDFIWPWVDMALLSFVPSVVLGIFNIGIFLRMRIQTRRVHATGLSLDNRLSSQRRTNVLLFGICLIFFLSTSPITVLHIAESYWSREDPHEQAIHNLVTAVTLQLLSLNNCLNFVLYCCSGREFRKDLKRMFCKRGDNNTADVSALA